MRILVTGHRGYIGSCLVPLLLDRGHEVVGLDSGLYAGCQVGPAPEPVPAFEMDIRDVTADLLHGFDAVIHLAAISNDPLGDLNPECTYDINYRGTVQVARQAREAGVPRFLFSSSCSLYGAHGDDLLDESAAFNPVTPYGESKVLAERDLHEMASPAFSPTYLRNATVYGFAPMLRGDLVVNNLVGYATTTGEVLLKSDGTPWRPLVHVEDVSRAFIAIAEAPRELVHDRAFNVGVTTENYRMRQVAEIVERNVAGSAITFASTAGPDKRNYRVTCDAIRAALPAFEPCWTVERGVQELRDAYARYGLTLADLTGPRLQRIQHIQALQAAGRLDSSLRVLEPVAAAAAG
ncbi:MAG: SDR family oxidoreductase [Dehalococcoidia bacterium]|nr:SDR family oxidoreductase [Dehalococcoidia bacterium]